MSARNRAGAGIGGRSGSRGRSRGPALLRRLLLRETLVRFAGGEAFLIGVMLLADLFSSMWRLLATGASAASILLWLAEGVPAHALEVLPVAYLFGITLSLAEMHADGELLVVWGSGISVRSLSLPVLLLSAALAAGMFAVEDAAAIPASVRRDSLYATMTGQKGKGRQVSDITIMADGGAFVYRIGAYDDAAKKLSDVDIVERDASGKPVARILAPRAEWSGGAWRFRDARVFSASPSGGPSGGPAGGSSGVPAGEWTEKTEKEYSRPDIDEPPQSFGIVREKPGLMRAGELASYVRFLKRSGLPSAEAETELHKRYAAMFTPLIVYGLSLAFAGLFRKNSLLMSLLFSLCTATVYYVAQMLGSLSAKTGWTSPALGVWSVTAAFLAVSLLGYLRAKT